MKKFIVELEVRVEEDITKVELAVFVREHLRGQSIVEVLASAVKQVDELPCEARVDKAIWKRVEEQFQEERKQR